MPLRIACPQGHTLIVSQARRGSTLRCPKCDAPVTVPGGCKVPALAQAEASALAVERPSPSTSQKEAGDAPLREPEPPPVVALPAVEPPPVWSPPPKSRAIRDPAQQEAPVATAPVLASGPSPSQSEPGLEKPAANALPEEPPGEPDPPAAATLEEAAPRSAAAPPAVIPTPSQRLAACVLALALAAAALFGSGPAMWDVVQSWNAAASGFIPRWALVTLALGGLQLAYAVYFAQLPDWLSGWVVTFVALGTAALYAAMLGVTLFAGQESWLIRSMELGGALANGRAAMWCLCMTTIMASLAYFAGRTSLSWRTQSAGAGL